MFDDIKQLEKEVQEFRDNILASKELVSSLDRIVAATQAQQEEFAKASAALLDQMKALPADIDKRSASAMADIQERIEAQQGNFEKKSQALVKQIEAIPSDLDQRNSAVMASIEKRISEQQDGFEKSSQTLVNQMRAIPADLDQRNTAAIGSALKRMDELERDLTSKYADFIAKLEASNMDKIFTMCEDIKKTVNSKLTILLGGVGLSIILSVIALIMK